MTLTVHFIPRPRQSEYESTKLMVTGHGYEKGTEWPEEHETLLLCVHTNCVNRQLAALQWLTLAPT